MCWLLSVCCVALRTVRYIHQSADGRAGVGPERGADGPCRSAHRWRIVFNYGCQNTHRSWRTPIKSKMNTHSKPQTPIAPISVSWRENAFFFYGTSVCKKWRVVGTCHTTCLVSVLFRTSNPLLASLLYWPGPGRVSGNVTSDRRSQWASYCRSQRDSDRRSQRASDRRRCQRA